MGWPVNTHADTFKPASADWNELATAVATDQANRNGGGFTYSNINIICKSLQLLTDTSGTQPLFTLGRVTPEARIGVAEATNALATGAVAGDLIVRSDAHKILLVLGTSIALAIASTGYIFAGGLVSIQNTTADSHLYLASVAPSIKFGDNNTLGSATMNALFAMATSAGHFSLPAAGDVVLATYGSAHGNIYINPNYGGGSGKNIYLLGVQTFASDAAAGTGGLATGGVYKDSSGGLHIKL